MQLTTRAVTSALILTALSGGIAACGDDDTAPPRAADPGAASTSPSGDGGGARGVGVNEADAAYVRQMIPHDAQVVVMAAQAKRSKNAEIRALAETVRATQIEELRALREFATARRYDLAGADTRRTQDAEALHTTAEKLGTPLTSNPSPAEFDRAFVELLIDHHKGSLVMSRAVRKHGNDEELADLSRKNVKQLNDQLDELEKLERELQ